MLNIKEIIESVEGITKVTEYAKGRRYYAEVEPKQEGEKFSFELNLCYPDNKDKNSLPNLWKKHGSIDRILENYMTVQGYYEDERGCSGRYSPTVKGQKVNFENLFEITEENIRKLVEMTIENYRKDERIMLVKIKVEEVLEFLRDGEDCKIEIDKDGDYSIIPSQAAGYEDTILKQELESYDYTEFEEEKDYIEWLKDCYQGTSLEAENGREIEIQFID